MKIGVDLDGTITGNRWYKGRVRFPWWIISIGLRVLEYFFWPKKEMVAKLRELVKEGNEIFIISLRPKELEELTRNLLVKHKVPFHGLLCVGLGRKGAQRKLEAVFRTGVEEFFDDDERIVDFLRENSINAHLSGELLQ